MQNDNKTGLALGGGIEAATGKQEFAASTSENKNRMEATIDDGSSMLIAYIFQERNCLSVIKWQVQMAVS